MRRRHRASSMSRSCRWRRRFVEPRCSAPAPWARRSRRIWPTPGLPVAAPRRVARRGHTGPEAPAHDEAGSLLRPGRPDAHHDRAASTRMRRDFATPTGSSKPSSSRSTSSRRSWTGSRPHFGAGHRVRRTRRASRSQPSQLGLPAELAPRWLGTHFFNPPRYLHLLELIPTPDTSAGRRRARRAISRTCAWARASSWPRTRRDSSPIASACSARCDRSRSWRPANSRSRRSTR